ncbi:MAG TPA: type II toxin-antitoxin system VapC family toxin [Terriglobales bacterium]|jgi:PIN domain nuclease of toxin-antitoxin system|nr:type II toxin-antitoxin system VapC family toxin [Terriglobales bacterium]
MIALLDTHTLRWWLDGSIRLSPTARDAIFSTANSKVISSVVPWELAIKTSLGKFDSRVLLSRWDEILEAQGFTELPIESAHAIRAGLLPQHHKDPFDRMLAAQAQVTGWPIVSADRIFDHYGVQRLW